MGTHHMPRWILSSVIGCGLHLLLAPPPAQCATVADYSGAYHVAVGHEPAYLMELSQQDQAVVFSLTGTDVSLEGDGTLDGATLQLTAELGEQEAFTATVEFSEDGSSFQGTFAVSGQWPVQGTLAGSSSDWQLFDTQTQTLPQLVTTDMTELGKISMISKFRSGQGHDYSDDFESCRSMKHYYLARDGVEHSSVKAFAPVTGTVIGTTDEWLDQDRWAGTAVGIRPDAHEEFFLALYHLDLHSPLAVGEHVTAGQELGVSVDGLGTVAEVAVGVHTPAGRQLISYFEIVTDAVFQQYRAHGVAERATLIISRDQRDAEPLQCEEGEFVEQGDLSDWIALEEVPLSPRRPRSRH